MVEGIHDFVVFNWLFGELRAARIALLSLEGIANYQAIIDSDALWRYTTAEVALTSDEFEAKLLEEVISDPEKAKALRKSDAPEETKILGKLIGVAKRHAKRIYLLGHRGDDLIDVLDEAVIKGEFPDYPGHEEARNLWGQRQAEGGKAKQKKTFYEQRFRIPNRVETYEQLAEAHAKAGVRPPELERIVNEAIALTRGEIPKGMVMTIPG